MALSALAASTTMIIPMPMLNVWNISESAIRGGVGRRGSAGVCWSLGGEREGLGSLRVSYRRSRCVSMRRHYEKKLWRV